MKLLKLLSSEFVLGTLVAVLSILAAVSGYQGSEADGDQTKRNVQGQQMLTNANAEYLSANQNIGYDYTMYDGWFTADDDVKLEYYKDNFSQELQNSVAANPDDPFSDAYYTAMRAEPQGMFDEADKLFKLAEGFDERSGALQLILLISALGLAFAAWASLLKDESLVRLVFAILSIAMLVYSAVLYVRVPAVVA